MHRHPGFYDYLCDAEKEHFANVTMQGMRRSCSDYKYYHKRWGQSRSHRFWTNWFYGYYANILVEQQFKDRNCQIGVGLVTLTLLTWVFGPVYAASRFMNVLMPMTVAIYLYV